MADKVLGLGKSSDEQKRARDQAIENWNAGTTAAVVLWLGLLLILAALADYVLAFYPSMFGSPEWEFATISSVVAGLPLVTIGMAGVWIGSGWLGRRWVSVATGIAFLVGAVCVALALMLFATNIPAALRATQENVARSGILKLIAKTLVLGSLFGVAYIVAGVAALRRARRPSS